MPGTTSALGLRYALLTDPANAQSGFQHLAEDVESWLAPLFVFKNGNESVSSSTTFQDDEYLTLPLPAANRYYVLDAFIQYFAEDNSTVPDLKFRFTFPSSTFLAFGRMNAAANTTDVSSTTVDVTSASMISTSPTTAMTAGAMGLAATLLIRGVLITTANPVGSLTFQWAQNASSGNATVVQVGSYMHLRRVA